MSCVPSHTLLWVHVNAVHILCSPVLHLPEVMAFSAPTTSPFFLLHEWPIKMCRHSKDFANEPTLTLASTLIPLRIKYPNMELVRSATCLSLHTTLIWVWIVLFVCIFCTRLSNNRVCAHTHSKYIVFSIEVCNLEHVYCYLFQIMCRNQGSAKINWSEKKKQAFTKKNKQKIPSVAVVVSHICLKLLLSKLISCLSARNYQEAHVVMNKDINQSWYFPRRPLILSHFNISMLSLIWERKMKQWTNFTKRQSIINPKLFVFWGISLVTSRVSVI